MAIRSMTGFARQSGSTGDFQWTWELKSVNGKGLDVRFRAPSMVDGIDVEGRKRLSGLLSRGSVNANLDLKRGGDAAGLTVNEALLTRIIEVSARHQKEFKLQPASIDGLLGLRGVLEAEDASPDEETLAELRTELLDGLIGAGEQLRAARQDEGQALEDILSAQIDEIERLASAARGHDGARLEAIRDRLAAKLADLLPEDRSFDKDRLEQEVAMIAIKADIREELDRLDAHIASARELLQAEEAIGRRLDFLAQEFNREANTLCSKSGDVSLTAIGLDLKAVVDQFREQIQNVE